jgi:hypothetical protein
VTYPAFARRVSGPEAGPPTERPFVPATINSFKSQIS